MEGIAKRIFRGSFRGRFELFQGPFWALSGAVLGSCRGCLWYLNGRIFDEARLSLDGGLLAQLCIESVASVHGRQALIHGCK